MSTAKKDMMKDTKKWAVVLLIVFVISFGIFALVIKLSEGELDLPIAAQMNDNVKSAYLFARDNEEFLTQLPCTCGCAGIGHRNNYDCFMDEEGNFIEHGSLCGGCVGITLDAKRLKEEGRSVEEIRAYILKEYPPRDYDNAEQNHTGQDIAYDYLK
ncbi:MAG: PCYCGC motif-containing (lipo)protein [Candidatus Nanoarchaeia archaeon]